MAKNNNLTDFLTDVADAIREKKGTTDKINPQEFSNEIKGIKTSSSMWTGHADAEGLKAIGWDDDDIAYFQEHGVNWMEEDDEYHKVPEDNKALYGIINYDNYKNYKDVIVYLPKFDMSAANGDSLFGNLNKLVAVPFIYLPNLTTIGYMCYQCYRLTCLPPMFDGCQPISCRAAFYKCYSLIEIPPIDFSQCTDFREVISSCMSLKKIHKIVISQNITSNESLIYNCASLLCVDEIDTSGLKLVSNLLSYCDALVSVKLKNLHQSLNLGRAFVISKESILNIINNEAATEAITIILQADAYARLATDPDIVAVLNNHPLVSLASA